MPIAPGTRVGPYVVNAQIGAGGMGEVYRATDTNLERAVAIKVLPRSMAADADRLARFEREAKTLALLNHPNIAHIYGLERSDGQIALVMELVDGDTLADRIPRGPIAIDEAVAIAKQIADALEAAHEQGIVHRDLKPANIKLRPDGQVKVLDFGLAKAMEPTGVSAPADAPDGDTYTALTSPPLITGVGMLLGTAAYMAPEQAKGRGVDKRADIWAFGVILYEMITGKPLFAADTIVETLAAVVTKTPDLTQVPAALRPLLQATLEPDPRRRLRDIGDAFRLLDSAASAPASPRHAGVLPIGLGVVAVLATVVAAVAVVGWRRQPSTPVAESIRLQINLPPGAQPDFGMALSPDGKRVAFVMVNAQGERSAWVRDLDSFEARPVRGAENTLTNPLFWSDDSRWLGFSSGNAVRKANVVEGGDPIPIVEGGQIGASWNADGTLVYGTNPGRNSGGAIFRVPAAGGEPTPLTVVDTARGEVAHHHPTFLPDGHRFLYLRAARPQERSGIFVGSLDKKPEEQSPERLIATAYGPVFFVQSRTSAGGLLFYLRDNTLMAQPFDPDRVALAGDPIAVASPVGSFIDRALFYVSRHGTIVYTTSATVLTQQLTWFDRRGTVLSTVGAPATLSNVALSADGTKAVVVKIDLASASFRRELWIWDLVRGTQTVFASGAGAYRAVWSPDNTRLAFAADFTELYERSVTGLDEPRLLLRGTPNDQLQPTSWSPDSRVILFSRQNPQTGTDIWALSRGEKDPVPLIQTRAAEGDARFSPDGKWIAYTVSEAPGQSEVYVTAVLATAPTLKVGGGPWRVSSGGGGNAHWGADSREIYYEGPQSTMVVPVVTDAGFAVGPATPVTGVETTAGAGGTGAGSPASRMELVDVSADGKRLLFTRPVGNTGTTRAPVNVLLNWSPPAVAAAIR